MKLRIVTSVSLCLFCCAYLIAQSTASLGGTVTDASGALIPGVQITAANVNTGITNSAVTNESGTYQFPSLQPGTYRLSASLPGFQRQTYERVELSQTQQVRLNFKLEVATVAQEVEVTVAANTVLAQTTASVGTVIRIDEVNLPLQTRNVMDLATATPGAVSNVTFGGTRSSQVNTTRDGVVVSDGRYMDWNGAFSATYTTPDLVEEVQVTTNTIDSENGRGSGQVRLQTRSGTNQYRGALFYTNNNSSMNSLDYFQTLAHAQKSYTNRNQFGGRIGGPIVENKAFFFFLYEGQRYLRKEDFVATVLTDQARQGVFRYLTSGATGANGGTSRRNGNAFATSPSVDLSGNILTSDAGTPLFLNSVNLFTTGDANRTSIDPVWVSSQLLTRMPKPNDYTVGDGLNTAGYRWLRPIKGDENATGVTNNSNRDQYNVRLDYQVSTNHKLFGVMSREKDTGLTGQAGIATYPNGYNGVVERRPDIYTAAYTAILSPSLLNQARFGLRRTSFYGWSPFHLGCCGGSSDTDINDIAKEATATFPTINGYLLNMNAPLGIGSPIAPHGTGATRGSNSPLWQFADEVSWTHGKHSIKGGVELIFANSDGWNTGNTDLYPRATLGAGSNPAGQISTTNIRGLNTNDVANAQSLLYLLAGSVDNVTQGFIINSPTATAFDDYKATIRRSRDIHENDWSVFLKDNWKLTNNFTVNVGLRYEWYGSPFVASGLAGRPKGGQAGLFGISGTDFSAMWNPYATGGSLTQIELIGKNSPNPNLTPYVVDKNNFAPSIGFSYSVPWLSRATVVRGGYGINYTGAATFLTYDTTTLAAIPGTDNLRTFTPTAYTNLSTLALPLTPTSAPFAPIPLTDRTVNFAGYDDHRVVPYVQNFQLSIQHELSRDLMVDISYSGTKGTKLWSPIQLNEVNIFENGILDAFKTIRAGGNSPLMNSMLANLSVPGVGTVNNSTLTGSEALRRYTNTNQFIANGAVADFANFLNNSNAIGGARAQVLRNAGLPENYIVVNPQFASVGLHGNNDNSTYHSLVTQVRKRLANGVSAQVSYVWSKSLGNTAIPAGVGTDTTATSRDPRNLALQKGPETFDRRHSVSSFGAWDLPFGRNRAFFGNAPSIVQRVIEGWQMSGIFNWSSGSPLGFLSTVRTLGRTSNVNTPDLVGSLTNFANVKVQDGFVEYFPELKTERAPLPDFGGNTTVAGRFTNQVVRDAAGNIILQNPEPGTTGNTSQRWFEGPGNLRIDAALQKTFQLSESRSFTIRADAVNFLNHPVWGNPNTDINSNSFGRITTATGARTVTIGARVDF